MTDKGPGAAQVFAGKDIRIGIIHGRWNDAVVTSLVNGAKNALTSSGVQPQNIIVQSVPGSYEVPLGAQRMITAAQTTSSATLVSAATDLLGAGSSATDLTSTAASTKETGGQGTRASGPLDAVIAIGVLIKGSTMHFEYIADAVTHGLMRVQLDSGVPVIFGILTCLTEEQARTRAGLSKPSSTQGDSSGASSAAVAAHLHDGEGGAGVGAETGPVKGLTYAEQGHNHGEDWGKAAVEMAVKRKGWGEGKYVE